MKKLIFIIVAAMLVSLSACGETSGNNANAGSDAVSPGSSSAASEAQEWYTGGGNIFDSDFAPQDAFADFTSTINAADIYASVDYTPQMFYGIYVSNYEEEEDALRSSLPFKTVEFSEKQVEISAFPVAVVFGRDYAAYSINNGFGIGYSDYGKIDDCEVALLKFLTKEGMGKAAFKYQIDGNRISFTEIDITGKDEAAGTVSYTEGKAVFSYKFSFAGPYLTLTDDDSNEITITSKMFADAKDDEDIALTGYSLPDTAFVHELDYFSTGILNYAVRRDGTYYDRIAVRLTSDGRAAVYLYEGGINSMVVGSTEDDSETFINEYAYIVQSDDWSIVGAKIVFLDGKNAYYYTDSITQREARILKEDGVDLSGVEEDDIEKAAKKKEDLFKDLKSEFEAQGIDVTINTSTGEMAMDSSVLFGGDSAEISSEGKALLNKFLAVYTSIACNEKYNGFIQKTIIEGHTAKLEDSTYESGLALSQERADKVKEYCLSAESGISNSPLASSIESVGCSNSRPAYNSDGTINKDASRRVSFRFVINIEKNQ